MLQANKMFFLMSKHMIHKLRYVHHAAYSISFGMKFLSHFCASSSNVHASSQREENDYNISLHLLQKHHGCKMLYIIKSHKGANIILKFLLSLNV